MAVRTTRINVSALARSAPSSAPRGRTGLGGGSFGLGLAPAITGFEFLPIEGAVVDGVNNSGATVATFKVDQPAATFELVNDGQGHFEILVDPDTGEPMLVDGYHLLVATLAAPDIADVSYEITIRATLGVSSANFIRTLAVEAASAEPFTYEVTASATTFDGNAAEDAELFRFTPLDDRLTVTLVRVLEDAGGVFKPVEGQTYVARGATEAPDGLYTAVLEFFFSGDDAKPETTREQTFTFEAFSNG